MKMKIQNNQTKEVPKWLLFYDFYHENRLDWTN